MPKWFTVATEGQTTDKRQIQRNWLQEMAAQFNVSVFGPRIWIEHMRGLLADSPFKAYGDVTAVRTQARADGKLQLQVQLAPTADLVALNKQRQKIYTSIEVDPSFADTGKAYLVGLAVTDTPASLGTDALSFCALHPDEPHPLAGRKQRPENAFSSAIPVELDFTQEEPDAPNQPQDQNGDTSLTLVHKLADALRSLVRGGGEKPTASPASLDAFGATLDEFTVQYARARTQDAQTLAALRAELADLKANTVPLDAFNELRALLDAAPALNHSSRPVATGAAGDIKTDC